MIRSILHYARFHWGGILAAALCALFIAAPLIAFPGYAGEAYRGININHYGTDQDFYLTRANEVLNGNGLGQPFLAEGKNRTDPTFYKIEHVILLPATALGLVPHINVVDWYNAANAVGIFVLTLLLYALAFALSKNRFLAVATAVFVIGGHSIIFYKTLFYDNLNIYGRSIFPYAASIPFFAFLLCLHRAAVERRVWFTVGAGAFFGFLFYDYFYAWTFALALLGSFFLISLFSKNWWALRAAVGVGVIGISIALPILVSFVQFFAGGEGSQIAYYLRATYTHGLVMSIAGLATLVLFCIHVWRAPKDVNNGFILASVLAGWIALEQQLVTGRVIEYGHYYWYFIVPLAIIVGAYIGASLVPKNWRVGFASLLIALALVNTVGGQYKSFFTGIPEKLHDQHYRDPLRTLDSLPHGVVLTGHGNESFPILVTIYTKNDLYFNPSALVYHTEEKTLRESLLVYLALHKDARENPIAFLEQSLKNGDSAYRQLYQDIEGYASGLDWATYTKKIEEDDPALLKKRLEFLRSLEAEYEEKASSPALLRSLLLESGVRYVLWDRDFYPEWDLSSLAPLKKLSESGPVILYELEQRL